VLDDGPPVGLGAQAVAVTKMTRFAIAITAAVMAVFLCVRSAAGQDVPCGPYSDMTKRLATQYNEQLAGRGIDAAGRMFEIWASPADGWTVILVRPNDMMSCVMLIGQKGTQWQAVEPKPDGPKS